MHNITRIFDLITLYKTIYKDIHQLFAYKKDGCWLYYSANEYVNISNIVSEALLKLQINYGDNIATIIPNSPIWNFIDMGIMQIGAVQVPIYPTLSTEEFSRIMQLTQPKIIFLLNSEMHERFVSLIPPDTHVVILNNEIPETLSWADFLTLGNHPDQERISTISEKINENDTATIVYTSGTSNKAKGVMLSHKNIVSNFLATSNILYQNPTKKAYSILPLYHVYERMLNYMFQYCGMTIYYGSAIEHLAMEIKETHAQTFCAVPRILEKIYFNIQSKCRNLPPLAKFITMTSLSLTEKYDVHDKNSFIYKIKLFFAYHFVFKKWKRVLSNDIKYIVSGSATLNPKYSRLFWAMRIKIIEGYGLTETAPVIAVSMFNDGEFEIGTVGLILDGVQVKLADDNEILCKGPNVMKGYYKQPELTAKMFTEDGWFKTGDIGQITERGFLIITDRKKELLKTSWGKYIAPQGIETLLKESPFIDNVIIIGNNQKFTSAIILPDVSYIKSWCNIKKIPQPPDHEIINDTIIYERIKIEVQQVNSKLSKIEQIKRFHLVNDSWSVAGGEISPTQKLRRKYIYKKYADIIELLYQ